MYSSDPAVQLNFSGYDFDIGFSHNNYIALCHCSVMSQSTKYWLFSLTESKCNLQLSVFSWLRKNVTQQYNMTQHNKTQKMLKATVDFKTHHIWAKGFYLPRIHSFSNQCTQIKFWDLVTYMIHILWYSVFISTSLFVYFTCIMSGK